MLRIAVIVALGLSASWWLPRVTVDTGPRETLVAVAVFADAPEPSDPPEIESPDGGLGEVPLPLGPDDLLGFLTDWVAGRVAEALTAMAEAITAGTLNLRVESLNVMDPADPSGFHDLSFGLARAGLLLLITTGGMWIMTHETLQTRISLKEILPRVVMAAIAMELSLRVLSWVIVHVNVVVNAILSLGFTPGTTHAIADTLTEISDSVSGTDSWLLLTLVIAITVMLTLLLVGVVSRTLLLMLLAITGPVAMACHALPATEAVTRWWWKALAACAVSAVGQALVLVLWMKVFFRDGQRVTNPLLMPDAIAAYADMLLVMALLWLMHKALALPMRKAFAPFGGNPVGAALQALLFTKSFGLVKGITRAATARKAAPPLRRTPPGAGGVVREEPGGFDSADPEHPRTPNSDPPKGPKPPRRGEASVGPRTETGWPKDEALVSTAVVPPGGAYAPAYRSARTYHRPAWHTTDNPFLPATPRPKPAPGTPPASRFRPVPVVEHQAEPLLPDASTPPTPAPPATPTRRRVRRRDGVRQW